jgi:hypothetical protein
MGVFMYYAEREKGRNFWGGHPKIRLATTWQICYIVIEIGKAREAATLDDKFMTS